MLLRVELDILYPSALGVAKQIKFNLNKIFLIKKEQREVCMLKLKSDVSCDDH